MNNVPPVTYLLQVAESILATSGVPGDIMAKFLRVKEMALQ